MEIQGTVSFSFAIYLWIIAAFRMRFEWGFDGREFDFWGGVGRGEMEVRELRSLFSSFLLWGGPGFKLCKLVNGIYYIDSYSRSLYFPSCQLHCKKEGAWI